MEPGPRIGPRAQVRAMPKAKAFLFIASLLCKFLESSSQQQEPAQAPGAVTIVSNGQEFVEALRKQPSGSVNLTIQMPPGASVDVGDAPRAAPQTVFESGTLVLRGVALQAQPVVDFASLSEGSVSGIPCQ